MKSILFLIFLNKTCLSGTRQFTIALMSDFFQTGSIATLHRLGTPDLERLETEIRAHVKERPLALVLPCHMNEIGSTALERMLCELREVDYLQQIVVGIDDAHSASDWQKARAAFSKLPQQTTLIWNEGRQMQSLFQKLDDAGLSVGKTRKIGKGRNLWTCFGYVLASGKARTIVAHDCDILSYDRELLARLCYPVVNPNFGFDFCKGYSARFSERLNGRAMRLLFTPLIRSLLGVVGHAPFLAFLDAFRYPLAGEICIDLDLARRIHIPADWGVEVGMLAEIYRVANHQTICQADLADRYEHKHQSLSADDSEKGLHKMAIEIAKNLFRHMAAEAITLDAGIFDTLTAIYLRQAEETVRISGIDAALNGLRYDRREEELAVATFAQSIREAARTFLEDPLETPQIPNWNCVQSALPDFPDALREIIEHDNR